MIRNASRKFALAITLLALAAPIGRAVAQSSTPTSTDPSVITGTNPEPQDDIVDEILALLFFA